MLSYLFSYTPLSVHFSFFVFVTIFACFLFRFLLFFSTSQFFFAILPPHIRFFTLLFFSPLLSSFLFPSLSLAFSFPCLRSLPPISHLPTPHSVLFFLLYPNTPPCPPHPPSPPLSLLPLSSVLTQIPLLPLSLSTILILIIFSLLSHPFPFLYSPFSLL